MINLSLISFKDYKIDEIGEVYSGGTPKTSVEDYWNGEIGWITPKDLSNYDHIYISHGERNISQKGLDNSSAKLVPKNTVLMTSRAPIGYIAIAKEELSTNQGFKSLFCNENICHYKYFYYWLKLNIEYIINNSNGSTFKEISGSTFKNLTISLPSLENQKRISLVLWNIDEKIENLRKLNKNLTNIVLSIFKNWFVDFNFLNENNISYKKNNGKMKNSKLGSIPYDWNVDILGNYLKIERGLSYKGKYLSDNGVPLINLGNILPNSEFRLEKLKFYLGNFDKKYVVTVGDILVANTDLTQDRLVLGSPIIVPSLIDKDVIIYSHHINRLSNFKLPKFYIFYNLLSERYNHMVSGYATGTTVLAISKEAIYNYPILIPPYELLLKFEGIAENIERIKDINLLEIKKLKKLQDILLPKLMSGEIDVSEVNCDLD